jgi:predicted transcriptional regulator of viral defense system
MLFDQFVSFPAIVLSERKSLLKCSLSVSVGNVSDAEIAAALVPFGVICLQSAAVLHEMTTLNPLVVTIAIPANRTRVALPKHPPVELVSYAMPTFALGLTETGASKLRVYDRERTVIDFFRKRKQLGDDLALEVLQSYMRGSRNLQTLFDYAGALRIKGVIKPYVEALI